MNRERKQHYLPVFVYRQVEINERTGETELVDCTNGGVSSRVDMLYVECDTGHVTDPPDELKFRVERRSPTYLAIVPVHQPEGLVGPICGGNLATTSDSRLDGIFHIHDRFDTQELYDALSI
jgi:hypothetical protein